MSKLPILLAFVLVSSPAFAQDDTCQAQAECPEDATCECDDDGNVTSATFFEADGETVAERWTMQYEGSNMLSKEIDWNADGVADSVISFSYQGGTLSERELDQDADGIIDVRHEFVLDSQGRIVSETFDHGADGTVEAITTNTYDADGNNVTVSYDIDADGLPDSICTYDPPCPAPYEECGEPTCEEQPEVLREEETVAPDFGYGDDEGSTDDGVENEESAEATE
ncbi:MAG: hypothetical protein KC561_02975 [Myxococcales bacterium]|nr:hypothetical protein [Myxococcales bacterium]